MHQNFQGLSRIVLSLIAVLELTSCESNSRQKTVPGPNDKIYTVELATVLEEEIPDILLLKGRFLPSLETEIKSPLAGKIQELSTQSGQNAIGGEVVLRIQNERLPYVLERQRAELREAEAELEYLNRIGFEEEPPNTLYRNNEEELAAEEAIEEPEQELAADEEMAVAPTNGTNPEELQERLQGIFQQRRTQNLSGRTEREREEIQESRQSLQQAKIERIQTEINLTERQMENTTVTAPFSGFVSKLEVSAGQSVEEGQVLFKLVKLDPIELQLEAPAESAALIKSQTPVKVTVPLIPQAIYDGYISFISARINPDTKSLPIKVSVSNFDQRIKAEMEGEAQIILSDSKHRAILVPQKAIVYQDKQPQLYVVIGQIAERRAVTLGSAYQEWMEIKEGLNPGDKVVSRGAELLREKEEFIKAENGI